MSQFFCLSRSRLPLSVCFCSQSLSVSSRFVFCLCSPSLSVSRSLSRPLLLFLFSRFFSLFLFLPPSSVSWFLYLSLSHLLTSLCVCVDGGGKWASTEENDGIFAPPYRFSIRLTIENVYTIMLKNKKSIFHRVASVDLHCWLPNAGKGWSQLNSIFRQCICYLPNTL